MSHENYSREVTHKRSTDRSFGLTFSAFFLIIALNPLLSGKAPRYWGIIVGMTLLLLSLTKPEMLAAPNKCWAGLGRLLHKVVNPIILAFLFFVIITPYAVVIRLLRRDYMKLAQDKSVVSYWVKRADDMQSYYRQF